MVLDLCEECRVKRETKKCLDCGKELNHQHEMPSLKQADRDSMRQVVKGFDNAAENVRNDWLGIRKEKKEKPVSSPKNRESEW